MKKSELVTLVAEKTGFSKKDTEKTIDTVKPEIQNPFSRAFLRQIPIAARTSFLNKIVCISALG